MRPSKDEVVDAATDLVMAVGVRGLSVRAVADRLDTTPAALLVDWADATHIGLEVMNRLLGEVPAPPEGGPWQKRLATYLTDVGRTLLTVPDMACLWCQAGHAIGENSVGYADVLVGCLMDGGFSPREADEKGAWLHASLLGWVLVGVEHDAAHQESELLRDRWDRAMSMLGDYPNMARVGQGKRGIADRSTAERLAGLAALLDAWIAGLALHLQ